MHALLMLTPIAISLGVCTKQRTSSFLTLSPLLSTMPIPSWPRMECLRMVGTSPLYRWPSLPGQIVHDVTCKHAAAANYKVAEQMGKSTVQQITSGNDCASIQGVAPDTKLKVQLLALTVSNCAIRGHRCISPGRATSTDGQHYDDTHLDDNIIWVCEKGLRLDLDSDAFLALHQQSAPVDVQVRVRQTPSQFALLKGMSQALEHDCSTQN